MCDGISGEGTAENKTMKLSSRGTSASHQQQNPFARSATRTSKTVAAACSRDSPNPPELEN